MAAGARYGALLRYLQAAIRFGALRSASASATTAATASTPEPPVPDRLRSFEPRLRAAGKDQSLGLLLLEAAQSDLAEHPTGGAANAEAIAVDVLPRYFAALEASPPAPRPP